MSPSSIAETDDSTVFSLGINYSQMHDSSACIVRDGETLFAVAEERLSRAKHDARFPASAIRACLDFAGIKAADLDFVCFGWQPPSAAYLHDLRDYFSGKRSFGSNNLLNSTRHFGTHASPTWRREAVPSKLSARRGRNFDLWIIIWRTPSALMLFRDLMMPRFW